ncbi:hypothetical protein [Roseovarius autotrophicus]|uniref:hypothetical protein n=1 Tax=Roseovarius autotrophicus TaxID=2824121 RepID=UPI001A04854D|nr:hypothetical protein [Roseovarius autotrophicus]MBE0452471.1 hypothetical protein [Roseovarius sp.]
MKTGTTSGVDQVGINLLRIVTGTFFMAIALDLIDGFDPAALFRPVLGTPTGEVIGAVSLLALAIWFMLGVSLRLGALSLALFVLSSSFIANFVAVPTENLSAFWYDLTLTCGVLLSYLTLDARNMRRASVFSHRARMRRIAAQRAIKPRRISPDNKASQSQSRRPRPAPAHEDESNIFANI